MTFSLPAYLAETETVTVETVKADGTPHRTPIWAVEVDGVPYIRSSHGASAAWYRRAVGPAGLAVVVDGQPRPVTLAPVTDERLLDEIDTAYRDKYVEQPQFVSPLIGPAARAATLRVAPV